MSEAKLGEEVSEVIQLEVDLVVELGEGCAEVEGDEGWDEGGLPMDRLIYLRFLEIPRCYMTTMAVQSCHLTTPYTRD